MRGSSLWAWGIGVVLLGALSGGCAAPKPAAQPSKEEVRKDSDRFFETLRQEEQAHEAGPEGRP